MKRVAIAITCLGIFLLLAMFLTYGTPATAQGSYKQKVLGFEWEQEIVTDLAGWKLYEVKPGDGAAKTYTYLVSIPYTTGAAGSTFWTNYTLEAPEGATTTKTYVLTAFDTSGNETTWSNEASVSIDFQAPPKPMNLRITIKAI